MLPLAGPAKATWIETGGRNQFFGCGGDVGSDRVGIIEIRRFDKVDDRSQPILIGSSIQQNLQFQFTRADGQRQSSWSDMASYMQPIWDRGARGIVVRVKPNSAPPSQTVVFTLLPNNISSPIAQDTVRFRFHKGRGCGLQSNGGTCDGFWVWPSPAVRAMLGPENLQDLQGTARCLLEEE